MQKERETKIEKTTYRLTFDAPIRTRRRFLIEACRSDVIVVPSVRTVSTSASRVRYPILSNITIDAIGLQVRPCRGYISSRIAVDAIILSLAWLIFAQFAGYTVP